MAAHGMNLALHRMDVGDRGIIEIAAPDERRELSRKASPSLRSPAMGRALMIAARSQFWPRIRSRKGRRHGNRDGGRAGIGPQPQIDAQHIAVGRALLQKFDEAAGDAHEGRRWLAQLRGRRAGGIEKNDEIRVARIVELGGAVLAERRNDDAATSSVGGWHRAESPAACARLAG